MTKTEDYFWPLNSLGGLLNRLLNSSGDTKFEKEIYFWKSMSYVV